MGVDIFLDFHKVEEWQYIDQPGKLEQLKRKQKSR